MTNYLGTWQVAPSDGFWTDQDRSESESVVSSAVRLGISGFDTAQSYGNGQAEQTLAKVLGRFKDRSFSVDTKIMPSSKDIASILKKSLARLSPLKIDTLYLHWPRSGFDNKRFIGQMARLRDGGLVRRIGVCNLPTSLLEDCLGAGLGIERIQRPLSLLWSRDYENDLSLCRSHGVEIATYSPTGMGLLSGRYLKAQDLKDARSRMFCFDPRCAHAYRELLDLVTSIAKRHGTTNTKIALSWTRSKAPDIVVVGARNASQLGEDLDRGAKLTEDEISDLDMASGSLAKASRDVCGNIFSYDW